MNGKRVRNFVPSSRCEPVDDGIFYGTFQELPYYVFSATHHGDRDEFWVVLMINGQERMRWNARHVVGIEWAEDE